MRRNFKDVRQWIDCNYDELVETFLKEKSLVDEFDEFCILEYEEAERGRADNLLDAHKEGLI